MSFGDSPVDGSHSFLGASVQLGAEQGLAAVAGLGAAPGTLDRHLGSVAAASWDPAPLQVNGTWSRFEVLHGYVKTHPTCAHLHGINDAVDDLVAAGLHGSDVESVVVSAYSGAACFGAVADSELAARFSVPTSVAVALLDGRLDETTLTAERVASRDVRDLAARVTVVHDAALDEGYPAGRPARVRVLLVDGSRREADAGLPRGDDEHRWCREALQNKAARLLTNRFGSAGDEVLAAVHALAADGDARGLGRQIRSAAASR